MKCRGRALSTSSPRLVSGCAAIGFHFECKSERRNKLQRASIKRLHSTPAECGAACRAKPAQLRQQAHVKRSSRRNGAEQLTRRRGCANRIRRRQSILARVNSTSACNRGTRKRKSNMAAVTQCQSPCECRFACERVAQ